MRVRCGRRCRHRRRRLRRAGAGRRWAARVGDRPRRQQRLRVDVALLVDGDPDAEMNVRLRFFGLSARADGGDRGSFAHRVALSDGDRPEVLERHGVPVRRLDRERPAALGHGAGEGDDARGRSRDGRSEIAGDVDTAMLARRVRVASEGEWAEHRPVHRPGPRLGGGGHDTCEDKGEQNGKAHFHGLLFSMLTTADVESSVDTGRCQYCLQRTRPKRPSRPPAHTNQEISFGARLAA